MTWQAGLCVLTFAALSLVFAVLWIKERKENEELRYRLKQETDPMFWDDDDSSEVTA